MNSLDALLILNAIPGFGPKKIRKLIELIGSPQRVVCASLNDLMVTGEISEHAALNLCHFSKDKFLAHEYELLKRKNVTVLTMDDESFPAQLKEIDSCPVLLYVRGQVGVFKDPSIAIVGSRRASLYGLGVARKFALELAEAGLTIVSGLARGIDTAAHQGALQARGITIAVLGCGLNHMYPAENDPLAERISQEGAVISEFSMETPPVSFNFPRRNRIISGLSKGVLVVEAALKSGALITSDFALEHGREVYAVPGQVGESSSQGTNRLIQQGAKLVLSVEDILEDLAPGLQEFRSQHETHNHELSAGQLTKNEHAICSSFEDVPLHIDELAEKSGLGVTQAAVILFKLELKKLVRQLPGQKYEKIKEIPEHRSTSTQEHKSSQA